MWLDHKRNSVHRQHKFELRSTKHKRHDIHIVEPEGSRINLQTFLRSLFQQKSIFSLFPSQSKMVQVIAINMIDLRWWERPVRHAILPDRSENPEFGVVEKSDLAKTLLSGEKAMIPRPVFCANILFSRSFVTMSWKGHCVIISPVSCDWYCESTMQLSCLKNKLELTSWNQNF